MPKKHHRFYCLHGLSDVHSLGPHFLPSLEKAHVPLYCITIGSHQRFLYFKEARQPAQGSLFTKTVLFPGSVELIKMPWINSQRKSPCCTFSSLEEMKAVFYRYEAPCLKPNALVLSFLGGISHRLLQLQTTHSLFPPLPLPSCHQAFSTLPNSSLYRASVAESGNRAAFNYSYIEEFFSLETQFQGSFSLKPATLILVLLLPPS